MRRKQYLTTEVDVSGHVALKLQNCAAVLLTPGEVTKLRQHLADAVAAALAQNGGWIIEEDE